MVPTMTILKTAFLVGTFCAVLTQPRAQAQETPLQCDCSVHTGSCMAGVTLSDARRQDFSVGNIQHDFTLAVEIGGRPPCADVEFQYVARGDKAVITAVPEYVVAFRGVATKAVTVVGPWSTVALPPDISCHLCRREGDDAETGQSEDDDTVPSDASDLNEALATALANASRLSAGNPATTLDPAVIESASERVGEQQGKDLGRQNTNILQGIAGSAAQALVRNQGINSETRPPVHQPASQGQGQQHPSRPCPSGCQPPPPVYPTLPSDAIPNRR